MEIKNLQRTGIDNKIGRVLTSVRIKERKKEHWEGDSIEEY